MRIPSTLKILGHPVKVYRANRALEVEDVDQALGLAHLVTNKIGICRLFDGECVSESIQAETLLHEISHHISQKMGLGLDESQISGMSCGMLQVIRDNGLDFLDTEDVMGQKGKGKKKAVAPVKGSKKGK